MPKPHQLPANLFTTIVQNTPLISIDLIIRNRNGEVLLGKRLNAPARGFWFTPGDRIYKDETIADAQHDDYRFISLNQLMNDPMESVS